MISVCVFEDEGFEALLPLTFLRPAYHLLVGCSSPLQKVLEYYGDSNFSLHCRDYIAPIVTQESPNMAINKVVGGTATLFVNGRVILSDEIVKLVAENEDEHDQLFTYQGNAVALYLHDERIHKMAGLLEKIPSNSGIIEAFRPHCVAKELEDVMMLSHPADLVRLTGDVIAADFRRLDSAGIIKGHIEKQVAIYDEPNIFIDKDVVVEDFVLLDARKGPIVIDSGALIQSHSRIVGPCFIGRDSQVLGARIRGSAIGMGCKVGGEVSESTLFRHSNKAHEGFLGNSYVGEWVNLGAMSTTSNLKINYKEIELKYGKSKLETGELFLGSLIGDHVKTGIGTLLNTGTIIGYGASIFGSSFHDQFIEPFSWGSPGKYGQHALDKFFGTAERMMGRREKVMLPEEKEIVQLLFNRFAKG